MKSVRRLAARAAWFVTLVGVVAGCAGCYDPYGCSDESDCFDGEQCRSGACVRAGEGDGARRSGGPPPDGSAETRRPCQPASGRVDAVYGDFRRLVERVSGASETGAPREVLLCGGTTEITEPLRLEAEDVEIRVREGSVHVLEAASYRPNEITEEAALQIEGDGLVIDGTPGRFVVQNSGSRGIRVVRSSDIRLAGVTTRRNTLAGMQIGANVEGVQVRYCVSHHNVGPSNEDVTLGGGAVGFYVGTAADTAPADWPTGVHFTRSLAHHNADDGFDFTRGTFVTVAESIAYANGSRAGDVGVLPASGFVLSRSKSEFYLRTSGFAPVSNNSISTALAWANGSGGVLVGSGTGMAVTSFRGWSNGGAGGANGADISFAEPNGAMVVDSIVTSIEQADSVTKVGIRRKDVSNLGFSRAVDGAQNPENPSEFLRSAGSWVEPTLRQERHLAN